MKRGLRIKGATTLDGTQFVAVTRGDKTGWISHTAFALETPREIKSKLASQGVVLIGSDWGTVVNQVQALQSFPPRRLIEQPGWTGNHFTMADGSVIGPGKRRKPKALFAGDGFFSSTKGTLGSWRDGVAAPLVGQNLLSFLLMAGFASPLLTLTQRQSNFGFELVGKGGCGKTTALYVMASACGPAVHSSGSNYWMSFNMTMAGMEKQLQRYNHLLTLFDEANLIVGSRSSQEVGEFRERVFRLSDGRTKSTAYSPMQQTVRTIYLTTANEPVSTLLAGGDDRTNAAAADRLITLMLDDNRPHGTFDFIPPEFGDATDFANHLKSVIADHYGVPLRQFLDKVAKARASDERALRADIRAYEMKFVRKVGVDTNDGSATRVAEAFGLVYAAGRLAVKFGVLPSNFQCMKAAKYCYAMYAAHSRVPLLEEQLSALAAGDNVIKLKAKKLPKVSDARFRTTTAFKRKGKGGRIELMVSRAALKTMRSDAASLVKRAKAAGVLIHDKDRNTMDRTVRRGKGQEPVYVFIIG